MQNCDLLYNKAAAAGQKQLFNNYEVLSDAEKENLLNDISKVDFELMSALYEKARKSAQGDNGLKPGDISTTDNFVDFTKMDEGEKERLSEIGIAGMSGRKLACLTLAGGQGTRLGHNGPKGTYDMGLPSHMSLFEIQAEGIREIADKAGVEIDWYIMTSTINHAETVAFFGENEYFCLEKEHVHFFPQTMIPAITSDGLMHKSAPGEILKSPNGNGGVFVSLKNSGCLAEMEKNGVEYLFICGIDNCLVRMCDPVFFGAMLDSKEKIDVTAKSYLKRTPDEKAGIFCRLKGRPGVLEYTEVPEEYACMKNPDGEWTYGDCNVLNYIFTIDAMKKLAETPTEYHIAVKKLQFQDDITGEPVTVTGGYKFELFLFDAFRLLDRLQVVRVEREEEFAPIKNPTGIDSAESALEMFMKQKGNTKMAKIQMKTPLVEMDGDEMTRVIWQKIKDTVILPFVDLKTEYYDLSIQNRDATEDRVTKESAEATKKYGVAVKCATITPNAQRVEEFGLHSMWKSPNATIRAALDGTVFRTPIIVKGIEPLVPSWKKPITIARHAYGDIYLAVESKVEKGGSATLVIKDKDGNVTEKTVKDFTSSDGIVMGMHNTAASIESFANTCFTYALDLGVDLWFSAKDTISKTYDHTFKDVFEEIYEKSYKARFEEKSISYFYTLVDDAIARVMKSEGGFLWACKNYDGDVFSDMLATAFGSLAMMTSVLVSPHGYYEYEAAHGTIPRHYHKYLKGEPTSTNPVATLFAWTGALAKRGELDSLPELVSFARKVEKAAIDTIESGKMTGDLALISKLPDKQVLNLDEFLAEVAAQL